MKLRKIYTIGETVYDIIISEGQIVAGKAGGSMLNASVSLGRLGMDVVFISEVGQDDLGELILNFLEENGVKTSFIQQFSDGRTPVALAFLDQNQNAKYTFYKQYPEKRFQQPFPVVTENDIVLFGSFFSLSPQVREPVMKFVKQAKDAGDIIIYDPNIRKPHSQEIPEFLTMIRENIALADIVRASDEDFQAIFDIRHPEKAFEVVQKCSKASLIFTCGGESVHLFSARFSKNYPVPAIEVVSTIGAGDNFNAGIAYSLIQQEIFRSDLATLKPANWDQIISSGISLSAEVCKSLDNYIPKHPINKAE